MDTRFKTDGEGQLSTLQALNEMPTYLPGCCLGLSSLILGQITQILPHAPKFTLSVGCGSGLFEAPVLQYSPGLIIHGVEIYSDPPINKYLPVSNMIVVGGTWDVTASAACAAAWLFVYPRESKLVDRYLQTYGDNEDVEIVVWLGPRADWVEFEPSFQRSALNQIEILDEVGLAPYEMVIVARKRRIHP